MKYKIKKIKLLDLINDRKTKEKKKEKTATTTTTTRKTKLYLIKI